MSKYILALGKLFFVPILILSYSCAREYKYSSINSDIDKVYRIDSTYSSKIRKPHTTSLGKKYYLCKVFGVLLLHPNQKHYDINWSLDSILKVLDETSLNEYKQMIRSLVSEHHSGINKRYLDEKVDLKDNLNLSVEWIEDTVYIDSSTSKMLHEIIYTYNVGDFNNSILKQSNIGIVKFKNIDFSSTLFSDFPNKRIRLLGLFYYWNFIEYFYPYKVLIDRSWDDVLLTAIPKFESVSSTKQYKKIIIELISCLDDNHSIIHPLNLTSVFGEYVPNFRMVKINRDYVVKKIRAKTFKNPLVKAGDIILEIDSVGTEVVAQKLSPFATGANEHSKDRELNKLVLCRINKKHKLKIKRKDSIFVSEVEFHNYQSLNIAERKEEKYWEDKIVARKVSEGIGYLNINHLFESNLEVSFKKLKEFENGVIIDMRGYPNAYTSTGLVNFVVSKDTLVYCSYYPDIKRPGLFRYQKGESVLKINEGKSYKGNIVILVDETTQSHAEFLVMTMETNPNVMVVGNTSSGTDGNVTSFTFPGDVEVKLTGLGILYPDFSQTQRKGVNIDYKVSHSYRDIVDGTDTWIEKGIEVLSNRSLHEI